MTECGPMIMTVSSLCELPNARITCRRKRAKPAVAGQVHTLLGCTYFLVLHHVINNELSQWITNVETAHTPRFALGAVFNWQACFTDPSESYLDVINLD